MDLNEEPIYGNEDWQQALDEERRKREEEEKEQRAWSRLWRETWDRWEKQGVK